MNELLTQILIAHVVIGLLGIIAFYVVWMGLLKREPKVVFLTRTALFGVFSFFLSWFSGGYYYVVYYGSNVKPVIKDGIYPWAHLILTEVKEHVFIFLPFLALIVWGGLVFFGKNLEKKRGLKRPLILLSAIIVLIGVFITLSGMIISGSYRP